MSLWQIATGLHLATQNFALRGIGEFDLFENKRLA